MKKLLFILCVCLTFAFGCSKKVVDPYTYGTVMVKEYAQMFAAHQFDSISANLKDWHVLKFRNDETRKIEAEYTYIKKLGKNQTIYVLEPSSISDSVYITKRITK